MSRDKKGRFKKDNEGFNITFNLPSLKSTIYWIIIIALLMPWIIIFLRFEILQKIIKKFEELLLVNTTENDGTPKKTDYFIK